MNEVLGVRPFVPAKDYRKSMAFYEALGFEAAHKDSSVVVFKLDGFGFILQNFYVEEYAANCMVQLLVRDVGAWWASLNAADIAAAFAAKPPIPPAMQHWGQKVGYIFDPSGILWHVAEVPS